MKELGIKTTQVFFWHWGPLSLGLFCSRAGDNYFLVLLLRKMQQQTMKQLLLFHNQFLLQMLELFVSLPQQKRISTLQQSLSVVYLCDCEICARTPCLMVGYILLQVLSLYYRTD